jgi:hypothetical protein
MEVLYGAKSVIDALIDWDENLIEEEELNGRMLIAKRQLLAQDHNDWVFECCRLTFGIMLAAIETRQPLVSNDQTITLALMHALQKTEVGDNWGDLSGILFWVSIIGSASSHPGNRVLRSVLGQIMAEITFTAFGDAVEPVLRFTKVQIALKRRSKS